MKAKLMIGTSIVLGSLLLLSFADKNQSVKKTEEYGMIVHHGTIIEKTANGKTTIVNIYGEKIPSFNGPNFNSDIVNELNKMNDEGYEIVSVSTDPASANAPAREVYLFKRKLQ